MPIIKKHFSIDVDPELIQIERPFYNQEFLNFLREDIGIKEEIVPTKTNKSQSSVIFNKIKENKKTHSGEPKGHVKDRTLLEELPYNASQKIKQLRIGIPHQVKGILYKNEQQIDKFSIVPDMTLMKYFFNDLSSMKKYSSNEILKLAKQKCESGDYRLENPFDAANNSEKVVIELEKSVGFNYDIGFEDNPDFAKIKLYLKPKYSGKPGIPDHKVSIGLVSKEDTSIMLYHEAVNILTLAGEDNPVECFNNAEKILPIIEADENIEQLLKIRNEPFNVAQSEPQKGNQYENAANMYHDLLEEVVAKHKAKMPEYLGQ